MFNIRGANMKIDDITFDDEYYLNDITKRIYYAETDAGGIVYYGNLCKYIESGCAEWFRKYVISLNELTKKYSLFFVMKEANLSYIKPVLYDEEITIRTKLKKLKYFSIQFMTEILVNGEKRYSGQNKMVPVDIVTKNPVKIPDDVLAMFLNL